MGDLTAVDMMLGALTDPFGSGHMGITAENVAAIDGIDRARQDELALLSHQRAAHAISQGYFKSQIVPIEVIRGRTMLMFETDERVRSDVTDADLAMLRPAFRKDGTVTAGNSSGINNGAAALVLVSEALVKSRNLTPLARIVATGLGGVAPEMMGLGPEPAVQHALYRANLTVGDLDIIESNEAFAAQACAVSRRLGFPPEKTNPNGGAIALGHPIGASGAIIMVKLVAELERTRGRYGLATMCIGGGQGYSRHCREHGALTSPGATRIPYHDTPIHARSWCARMDRCRKHRSLAWPH